MIIMDYIDVYKDPPPGFKLKATNYFQRRPELGEFLASQIRQLKAGGMTILGTKLRKLGKVLLSVPFLPAAVLMRCFRPWVTVRVGRLRAERVGHLAGNTELYLCKRDLKKQSRPVFDIFYYLRPLSNRQLLKMIRRVLTVWPAAEFLDIASRMLPGWQAHAVYMPVEMDPEGLIDKTAVHLSFTRGEAAQARAELSRLGVDEARPWICFHVRDNTYLINHLQNENWEYHNYRNSDINRMMPAMRRLTDQGYTALRMGVDVSIALSEKSSSIIDYAFSDLRSELLDIYLCAHCRFFVGTTAGLCSVPRIFRKPIVYVNFTALSFGAWTSRDLVIPKRYRLKASGRELPLKEILETRIGEASTSRDLESHNVELIENTENEISAVVEEMELRLSGEWTPQDGDEELQRRMQDIYSRYNKVNSPPPRIGARFLRDNPSYLEIT